MSIKLEIFSGVDNMLDEIAKANYGLGLDALDQAGIKLRDATRRSFRSSTTNVRQFYKDGKWQMGGGKQAIGKRVSHRGKANSNSPASMESFITSNLMEKSMTMVVAGKHPRTRPKQRRDGKVIGSYTMGSVTKGSYAILQKLNYGDDSDSEYKKIHRTEAQHRIFDDMKWRKQNFIEKGRSSAMAGVKNIMTSKLESLIHKQINRTDIKVKKVGTA